MSILTGVAAPASSPKIAASACENCSNAALVSLPLALHLSGLGTACSRYGRRCAGRSVGMMKAPMRRRFSGHIRLRSSNRDANGLPALLHLRFLLVLVPAFAALLAVLKARAAERYRQIVPASSLRAGADLGRRPRFDGAFSCVGTLDAWVRELPLAPGKLVSCLSRYLGAFLARGLLPRDHHSLSLGGFP